MSYEFNILIKMHLTKTVSLFLTSFSLAVAAAVPDDDVARREAMVAKALERRDYYGVRFLSPISHACKLIRFT